MPEINRLNGSTDWIDFDFVEHERTPETAMAFGINRRCRAVTGEYRRIT